MSTAAAAPRDFVVAEGTDPEALKYLSSFDHQRSIPLDHAAQVLAESDAEVETAPSSAGALKREIGEEAAEGAQNASKADADGWITPSFDHEAHRRTRRRRKTSTDASIDDDVDDGLAMSADAGRERPISLISGQGQAISGVKPEKEVVGKRSFRDIIMPNGSLNRRVIFAAILFVAVLAALGWGGGNATPNQGKVLTEEERLREGNDKVLRVTGSTDTTLASPETLSTSSESKNETGASTGQLNANNSEAALNASMLTPPSPSSVMSAPSAPASTYSVKPSSNYTPTPTSPAVRDLESLNNGGNVLATAGIVTNGSGAGRTGSAAEEQTGVRNSFAIKLRGASAGRSYTPAGASNNQVAGVGGAVQLGGGSQQEGNGATFDGIRTGNSDSSRSRQPTLLPRGTRISLTLLEPLRSGIATTADARVMSDVRDGEGKVVIPAGTIISIPFLAAESNGRMMNDSSDEITVTSGGARIVLRGNVKGPDGFAGIGGKVTTKGGGSLIGKIARGGARIAGSIGGGALGGVNTHGVEDEVERASRGDNEGGSYVYGSMGNNSKRTVEVPAGIRFTLVTR